MKPFLATILLNVMLLPFGGSYLFLELERSKAKTYAIAAMADEENPVQMVWLRFSNEEVENDLRWEHDREFEYNGQMYDVSKRIEKGDSTHFYCYWDKLETLVNQKLADLIATHTKGGDPSQNETQLILSLFKAVYLNVLYESNLFLSNAELKRVNEIVMNYSDSEIPNDSPPPRHS